MFVIISGIDKVGKTTMAKEISNIFNIPYIKFAGPHTIKTDDALLWARDVVIFHESILRLLEKLYEQHIEIVAVIDRFYPDEIVYSKIFRNVDLFENYKDIDKRFARMNAILIYVEPPPLSVLKERWKEEKKVDIKRVYELTCEFDKFINYTKLHVHRTLANLSRHEIRNLIKRLTTEAINHEYD